MLWIAAAAASAIAPDPAQVSPPDAPLIDIREMYFVRGTCTRLIVPEGDRTAVCNKAVGHVLYGSGRTSFWFSIPKRALISFSGQRESRDGDRGTLELDLLTMATSPNIPVSEGQGTCSYDNPWKGTAHIRCQGHSKQGEFVAEFTTDGKPPDKVGGDGKAGDQ